jgi:hypothetical protein
MTNTIKLKQPPRHARNVRFTPVPPTVQLTEPVPVPVQKHEPQAGPADQPGMYDRAWDGIAESASDPEFRKKVKEAAPYAGLGAAICCIMKCIVCPGTGCCC